MSGGRVKRGMTLVELLIAIALIAMLMAALTGFYWQAGQVRSQTSQRVARTQIARNVLTRIAEELRNCVGFDQVGFPVEQRLVGDRRSITFLTTQLPGQHQYEFLRESEQPPAAQHDLTLVSYRLWVDDRQRDDKGDPLVGGIIRTEKKTLNQFLVEEDDPLQQRNDLWSSELGYLEFRYFDGYEWDTKWEVTQGNSLPQLVMVTVGFGKLSMDEYEDVDLQEFPIEDYPLGPGLEFADRHSIIVRLPAADKFFGSRVQRVGQQMSEQLGVGGQGF
ncbi:MAG: prepilin-type N-terminal cleavage/methylation domain-containing protein [Phycisphaerae bacterium]|nr:prepilin-type N-terminal cleavage/methylation domain-containing protein [Phycisphaerae bacterium]MCZ2399742.1 prepilin-type N-terminal cleavage/methylation domain-containing protein [Phycisphaerae bacterium]NUQ50781.1 prepilin-type N-terminal cleavage/methylation domain-containing protein [Phycisphaerae bacterium]